VADLQIHELPSARGCTHYVPAADYALALKVSQGTSEVATLNTAKKWLGFTDKNLEELNDGILNVLQDGPLDPKGIRERLGDRVISFGEEGKKRGQTTSLPIGLGWLQAHGHIRRIPAGGRLDVQTYSYALWTPNPLDGFNLTQAEACTELARRYFRWIGPAKLSHFQWFSGLGVGVSKAAVEPVGLETVFEEYLWGIRSSNGSGLRFDLQSRLAHPSPPRCRDPL
jgi:Winged helix DNA-binding domain